MTNQDSMLEYDRIPVRTLTAGDLDAVVRIDRRITGRARRAYFELKLREVAEDSRIFVSLGAEVDGHLVGYLMAKVFTGEFGVLEPSAILDTIGVDPDRARTGVGRALITQFRQNLAALGVDSIRTQADWDDWALLRFLKASGFQPLPRVALECRVDTA